MRWKSRTRCSMMTQLPSSSNYKFNQNKKYKYTSLNVNQKRIYSM